MAKPKVLSIADQKGGVGNGKQAIEENGYSKGRILQFSTTTNQLLEFMSTKLKMWQILLPNFKFGSNIYSFKYPGVHLGPP